MKHFGIGHGGPRREDQRLLTGKARYTDDIKLAELAYAYFLRSPHAHAKITAVNTKTACAYSGVLAVFVGADVEADGLGGLPCLTPIEARDGKPMICPPRPLLAGRRVRHAGEPIVMVVAESPLAAQDAAEQVVVDFEPLPALVNPIDAMAPGAPRIHEDIPDNIAFRWSIGDEASTAEAFAHAPHVTALDLVNNRLVANPMEPRNAIGEYEGGRYTLICGNQGGHLLRSCLSEPVLKVPEDEIQVITPDVGGGFGTKIPLYPDAALVLWAAKKVGRPIKWVAERRDGFLSDTQGRDLVTHAELAHDGDGKFLALRLQTTGNLGAYPSAFGPSTPTIPAGAMTGAYHIPAVSLNVVGVYTNTVPIDVYRGVGRCEAAYTVERLVETVARELGADPGELRRSNFVRPAAMPYALPTGVPLTDVDLERNMDRALRNADWEGMAQRRTEARSRARLRGIGMSSYIGPSGTGPSSEEASIVFEPDGAVAVHVGSQSNGQGHETVFPRMVAERLGVDFDGVRFVQGDTDVIPFGVGTFASRSLGFCGSAISLAADQVIHKATKIAAQRLEVAEVDVEFLDGVFKVTGTDRSIALAEVAVAARDSAIAAAARVEPGLDARVRNDQYGVTVPSGCHICEVEVDVDCGVVEIVGYTAVDDFGRVANPMIVDGQVHGGVAQGIGQSLLEHTVYDERSGQLLSATLMDYCLPRADDVPFFALDRIETPCTTNPLGIKGSGEAGTIAAPSAVVNAIVDALSGHGVSHIQMPATPERLWRAIRRASPGIVRTVGD